MSTDASSHEFNIDDVSKEELYEALKQATAENDKKDTSIKKLEAKRRELLADQRKRKNIANILEQVGLDVHSEDLEEKFTEIVESAKPAKPAELTSDSSPVKSESSVSGVSDETAALLKRMESQIQSLKSDNEKKEQERLDAIEANRREHLERKVLEAMREAGAPKPEHLLKLTRERFRYSEDGARIVGGEEYDEVPLESVIGNLKDDDEFSDYFTGSGKRGSGFAGATPNLGGTSIDNPFRQGGNATTAAKLLQSDPTKARSLMNQAKAAGKLDPHFADLAS